MEIILRVGILPTLLEFPWNFEELAPELYGKKDNDADHKPDCRASE
jgi:hypothetical protein